VHLPARLYGGGLHGRILNTYHCSLSWVVFIHAGSVREILALHVRGLADHATGQAASGAPNRSTGGILREQSTCRGAAISTNRRVSRGARLLACRVSQLGTPSYA